MSSGIGQSIRIKGEIVAREPFLVAGRIEGTIEVDQHTLTIAETAKVDGTVTANEVIIEGAVNGDLAAVKKIEIRTTAKAEGEFSAPNISIAEGAQVQGKVETTARPKGKAAAA